MKSLILIIFFFYVIDTAAQEKSLPTLQENLDWIEYFKKIETKENQIDAIKSKVYSDTLFSEIGMVLHYSSDPAKHFCKTIFILRYKSYRFHLDITKNPNVETILRFINSENISGFEIDDQLGALYRNGKCAVVFLNCNKAIAKVARNVL